MRIGKKAYYRTKHGGAYLGDSLEIMRKIPDESIDLVLTSPPFALQKKKEYGNVPADDYVAWFLPFAIEMKRIIKKKGSIVIDLGGSWKRGQPVKSLYQWRLLIALHDIIGLYLSQEFYWFNPAKLPTPAQWVTIKRIRVKDAVNMIFWLSKDPHPKASNMNVLKPYSQSMLDLIENGYNAKLRPSGHNISSKFQKDNKGAIPPNFFKVANTESNSRYLRACRHTGVKPNPARFPADIPRFFLEFLTDEDDIVLDPFAGSNVTGAVSENLKRNWIAIELNEDYLTGSKFRFPNLPDTKQILLEMELNKTKASS